MDVGLDDGCGRRLLCDFGKGVILDLWRWMLGEDCVFLCWDWIMAVY